VPRLRVNARAGRVPGVMESISPWPAGAPNPPRWRPL